MADSRDDDKPQYTLYRARPRFLSRRGRGAVQEPAGYGAPPPPPAKPRRRWWPRRRPGRGRRITVWRVLRWLATALAAWLLVSLILFLVSAQIQSAKVSDDADAELGDAGYTLTAPNTVLVLGSDARTKDSKEPDANK